MADPQTQLDPLEVLADEFAARCRRGESPSVSEFADRHGPHAEQIKNLFPAIAMMERLRAAKNAEYERSVRQADWPDVPTELGDLKIIREMGRGGMGIVFEAQQRSLGRRVAVKVLPNHRLLCEKDLQRFRHEAQTAAGLHHTNIVPVYGVGKHKGVHYYVMPLVRGVGLDEVIRELQATAGRGASACRPRLEIGDIVRQLSEPQRGDPIRDDDDAASSSLGADHWPLVAGVGIQAASALGFAHEHGTLHRDVKPGNLLVDTEGVVRVADFGLARAIDPSDANPSGDALGTLRYMAPEQFDGRADARSDIYSLGLTLYELATLQSAFAADHRAADHRAARRRDGRSEARPVRPAKFAPNIPRDLETIILKCLADQPAHRYQTADDLAADLQLFLDDRPIHARRVSVRERISRWGLRNPALAALSALATLLLIAVAMTVAIGYVKTQTAHAKTAAALERAEANSELALDVLERIYKQLAPERFGVCSDSHDEDQPCRFATSSTHPRTSPSFYSSGARVRPSQQTAVLLENLLGFYDALADRADNDGHVVLESAIASRRVGDIRQQLGQPELAERAYRRTIERLSALGSDGEIAEQVATELARNHNEIGNGQSARQDAESACASHQRALAILRERQGGAEESASFQYELARTLYFLTNNIPVAPAEPNVRGSATPSSSTAVSSYRRSDYRQQASAILEKLVHRHPGAPGYRFLLALCRRPLRPVTLNSRDAQARQDAVEILTELAAEYPDVDDYRYELATTRAWLHVGLYPWQTRVTVGRDVEPALREALDELQRLVERNPAVPQYARAKAVTLAKLGTACWTSGRLPEAETCFAQALATQDATVRNFPDFPSHNRILREFFRLRGAQIRRQRYGDKSESDLPEAISSQLDTCIDNLTRLLERHELAEDRLARLALREACSARGLLP